MATTVDIVKAVNERETSEEYIGRYTNEELHNVLSDSTSSVEFCGKLLNICSEQFEQSSKRTDEFHKLWNVVKSLNNYGRIEHFIRMLKPARNDLLKSLETNAEHIEQYAKFGLYMRLMGSVGDIAGTVGDFLTTGSSSDYSNYAFTADVLGFLGDACPLAEAYLSYNAYDDTVNKIQKDQKFFSPIENWFKQSDELEEAVLNIFPFDFKERCLNLLCEAAETELRGASLLARILEGVIMNDIEHLRDGRFMENLTNLFVNSLIEEVFTWLRFRPNQIQFDILRMDGRLMIDSFIKLGLRQLVSKLRLKHHLFLWPRIGISIWSILQAFRTLRKFEISEVATEMRRIKVHLQQEMAALERIIEYIESKRNE